MVALHEFEVVFPSSSLALRIKGACSSRLLAALAALVLLLSPIGSLSGAEVNPLSDWSVEEGYSLQIVAKGFSLPTAIAIVPNPDPNPKSPRMFVTELRGTIKAVANDWSVTDFARIQTFKPEAEWPDGSGEAGMAGICLAPAQGYVFVTYTYRDKWGVLRNGASRFSAKPQTFEGTAAAREDYLDLFRDVSSAFSHQIGGCVVSGDSVFIGVGDGGDPAASRSLEKMLGKIVRLTLDGKPYPANPFASAGGKPASIFAYGLRNPFGLTFVDGRLFVAENGVDLDRFLEIRAGTDYGWDGTDASIATNAAAVFAPTICPVQVAYAPETQSALLPRPNPRFLIAVSNSRATNPGILSLEYDLARRMVIGSPRFIAHFDGQQWGQGVVGLAIAPGGLYFCPILDVGGSGVLMAMRYDPEHVHSRIIGRGTGPAALIATYGCIKCHLLQGTGGNQGPALDSNSLAIRVESRVLDPSYAQLIARLDAIPDPAVRETAHARKEVLSAAPPERVKVWIVNRLLYPKFDEPNAQMPSFKMTREQAEAIAGYLLQEPPKRSWLEILRSRRFLAGVGLGLVAGLAFAAAFAIGSRRRPGRQSQRGRA